MSSGRGGREVSFEPVPGDPNACSGAASPQWALPAPPAPPPHPLVQAPGSHLPSSATFANLTPDLPRPHAGGWARQGHAGQGWPGRPIRHPAATAAGWPCRPWLCSRARQRPLGFLWRQRWQRRCGARLFALPSAAGARAAAAAAWQPWRRSRQPGCCGTVCSGQRRGPWPRHWRCCSWRQPRGLCRGARRRGRRQAVWSGPRGGGL